MQALVVCRPISKLAKIASQVLWQKDVLLLVLFAGVASTSAYTLGGAAASAYLISWCYMFRVDIRVDQRGGAALGTSGAAAWAVRTFGGRCGGGSLRIFIPVSIPLCAVLKGVGVYRYIGVATLGGGIKATLGGGADLRRGHGLMVDPTLNFSGAGLSVGAGR